MTASEVLCTYRKRETTKSKEENKMKAITLNELISELQKLSEYHGSETVASIGTTSRGEFNIRLDNGEETTDNFTPQYRK